MPRESQPPSNLEQRRPEVRVRVPKIFDPSAQSVKIFLCDGMKFVYRVLFGISSMVSLQGENLTISLKNRSSALPFKSFKTEYCPRQYLFTQQK
jgi:hypothetical protein